MKKILRFIWRVVCFAQNILRIRVMVFNATFNNISAISWQSILLVEETGVPGENHRPVTSHWQTLSQNLVLRYTSPWAGFELTVFVGRRVWRYQRGNQNLYIKEEQTTQWPKKSTGSCNSNFHMITILTAPNHIDDS
jgi:hypothetical protein